MEMYYPDYQTEYFDGLELNNIAQLLNNRDGMSIKFKHEIVEQLIAYLIRLKNVE
jgi:hypothetical protein